MKKQICLKPQKEKYLIIIMYHVIIIIYSVLILQSIKFYIHTYMYIVYQYIPSYNNIILPNFIELNKTR